MKIYTKGGDKGFTSLIGGKRLAKHNIRIEAYGNIDELISYIGLVRDLIKNENDRGILLFIQDKLMVASSIIAIDPNNKEIELPKLCNADTLTLEQNIDKMETELKALNSFILPGGHIAVSHCHIARTVCRRTERSIVKLGETEEVPELIINFFNRLSDYLFVLARKIAKDFNIEEIRWQPKL